MAYAPYTSSPTADAATYFDALHAENEQLERDRIRFGDMILELFTKSIRVGQDKIPLFVPHVTRDNRISGIPIADVITDEICFGKPLDALMDALQKSDCPFVSAIRFAIAQSYISSNADDLAGAAQ